MTIPQRDADDGSPVGGPQTNFTPPGPPPVGMTPPPPGDVSSPVPQAAAPEPSYATPFPQAGTISGFTVDSGFAAAQPPRPTAVKLAAAMLAGIAATIIMAMAALVISALDDGFGNLPSDVVPVSLIALAFASGFLALASFVWLGRDGARITAFACCGAAGFGALGVVLAFAIDLVFNGYGQRLGWLDFVMPVLLLLGSVLSGGTIVSLAGRSANDWFYQLRRARSGRL